MHPKTLYKFCKTCENRARNTPLLGVFIPHFDQIAVKISVLGDLYPYRCTDGGEISPPRHISPPSVQSVARGGGAKNLKIGL